MTTVAKRFGPTQGKAAQSWVEEAIKAGDANGDSLMQMQLTLFEECTLDDESGRCKELTDAIAALTTAVEDRKNKPKTDECAASPRPTPKFSCPLVLLLNAQSLIPNCVAQSTSNF